MSTARRPDIFKAYDIRGLYGEQIDGDLPSGSAAPSRACSSELAGKPVGELRVGLGPRHAPQRPRAGGALPRGAAGGGRARARRRPGRHRDALLPRRLARARRRADVHRLAQPEGLHRAPSSCARARSRCPATSGIQDIRRDDRSAGGRRTGAPAGTPRGDARARSTSTRSSSAAALQFIDADAVRSGRRLKVVVDGGNGMAGPMVGPLLERLGLELIETYWTPGRQLPRPRAQPAAAGEPAVHHRAGARARRRPRDRLGRRRRPLLLHRRHRARSSTATSSRRCWPSRCCAKTPAARRSSTTCAPRGRSPDTVTRGRRHAPTSTASATPSSRRGCARRARCSAARSPGTTTSATSTARTPGTIPALLVLELLARERASACRELLEPYRSRYFISGEINSEVADAAGQDGGDRRALRRRPSRNGSTASRSTTRTGTSTCAPRTPSRCCACAWSRWSRPRTWSAAATRCSR